MAVSRERWDMRHVTVSPGLSSDLHGRLAEDGRIDDIIRRTSTSCGGRK